MPRLGWDEYCARWTSLHGGFDPRRAPLLVRVWQRLAFVAAGGLARLGVAPVAVTLVGLGCALAVPVVVLVKGWWVLVAAGLALASALADSVDSGVAVASGRITGLGSFADSVADRLSEIAWLVALWLIGGPAPLAVACGAVALLHEYARSRAALAGMPGVPSLAIAERPTRVVVAVVALVLSAVAGVVSARLAAGVVTVGLAVWLVLGLLGGARLVSAIRDDLR
ncbi:MAG: CDP-alcohol phosphatidyltransferase family protein [Micromonosporaceae bacterium]|nr:CDP-alcohol phosphatidyltransferase family protein [Micromonosporaceae bacterium]